MASLWLFIIILSYIFFGLFSLGDKLLLSGHVNAKTYTFYVGILNVLAVVFIPFVNLTVPNAWQAALIIANALAFILGLYVMFLALEKFEVSRVMPTIGALQPIFIFFAAWAFFGLQVVSKKDFSAFIILMVGTFAISKEQRLSFNSTYVALTVASSLLFSLDYVFSKIVFSELSFLPGWIWTRLCIFLLALLLLASRQLRGEVFSQHKTITKRNSLVFVLTQSSGALAAFLQSIAIVLAPVAYLAIMNSLRGIQYVFLFLVTLMFSRFFPNIFKEEVSKKIVMQKSLAILIIMIGLAILVI